MSTNENHQEEQEFSFKSVFVPLTSLKAIHIIAILGLVVFGNALFNGFVWDDMPFILFNPDIHTINMVKIFGASAFNSAFYRPLPALYFSVLYAISHDSPFFYHLFQVVLHIVNATLVFFVMKKFFKQIPSVFLSLIFLVHPIQVESVGYIAQTVSPLFTFFGLSAFLLSLTDKISQRRLFGIGSLLLLNILTKETGILFFVVIAFYRFLFKTGNNLGFFISGGLTILVYLLMRLSAIGISLVKPSTVTIPITTISFSQRIINIPEIIYYYVKTLFFPINLVIDQQWVVTKINFSQFYFPLLIDLLFFLLLTFLGIYVYKKKKSSFKIFLFFFVWFSLGLLFHLQIVPLDMTVAERFFYFPIIGLLGLIGLFVELFIPLSKNINLRTVGYFGAIVIIILLSLRTIARNANWQNGITLYTHDSKLYDNYDIENNLGNEYATIQDSNAAIEHYKKALVLFPREITYFNIADTYEHMGNVKEAKSYYYKALNAKLDSQTDKHAQIIYARLGTILAFTDDPIEAKNFIKQAINDYPDAGELWYLLGVSEYKLGNQQDALSAAKKANTLSPNAQTNYLYNQLLNNLPVEFRVTGSQSSN